MRSPRIERHQWGSVDVEGARTFKDARLFPGGAEEWDWGLHGTRHTPGVGIDEVEDLVARGAAAIVLSRGREGHLQVPAATVAHLRERGVEVDVLWTDQAIDRYNERAARGERVAALIHSTC